MKQSRRRDVERGERGEGGLERRGMFREGREKREVERGERGKRREA